MCKAHEEGGDWTSSERLASAFLTLGITGNAGMAEAGNAEAPAGEDEIKTINGPENEPATYEAALRSPQAREWEEAMRQEWQALLENHVTLGLYRNRSVERIKGNQATFDNSQRNNLRSCLWGFVEWSFGTVLFSFPPSGILPSYITFLRRHVVLLREPVLPILSREVHPLVKAPEPHGLGSHSLPTMHGMESYDRCRYRNGHGNTSLWTLLQAYRDQKDSMQFAWWSIA